MQMKMLFFWLTNYGSLHAYKKKKKKKKKWTRQKLISMTDVLSFVDLYLWTAIE